MNQGRDETPWGLILGMAVLIALAVLVAALVAEDPDGSGEDAAAEEQQQADVDTRLYRW